MPLEGRDVAHGLEALRRVVARLLPAPDAALVPLGPPDRAGVLLSEALVPAGGPGAGGFGDADRATSSEDSEADRTRLIALVELARTGEARVAVTKLKAERPTDARVRARYAAMTFETIVQTGGTVEGASYVHDQLTDDTLTDKDGYYWSLLIGAQGLRAMSDALPELARNAESGAVKMAEILKTIRGLSDELAKSRPGRAAVLSFVLDRTVPLVGVAHHFAGSDERPQQAELVGPGVDPGGDQAGQARLR